MPIDMIGAERPPAPSTGGFRQNPRRQMPRRRPPMPSPGPMGDNMDDAGAAALGHVNLAGLGMPGGMSRGLPAGPPMGMPGKVMPTSTGPLAPGGDIAPPPPAGLPMGNPLDRMNLSGLGNPGGFTGGMDRNADPMSEIRRRFQRIV